MLSEIFNPSNYAFLNPWSIPNIIVSAVLLSLGVFVISKNPRQKINWMIGLFSASIAWWQGFFFLAYNTSDANLAFALIKIGFVGVIFFNIYSSNVIFLIVNAYERFKRFRYFSYIFSTVSVVVLLSTNLILDFPVHHFWGYYTTAGPLLLPFIAIFSLQVIVSMMMLFFEMNYRSERFTQKQINQMKYWYICLASIVMASIDFFPNFGVELYPHGYLYALLYASIISYAIVKYNLMDIETFLHKTIMWFFTSMSLFIPFLVITIYLIPLLNGVNVLLTSFIFMAIFIILLKIYGFLQPKIDYFFRKKAYDLNRKIDLFLEDASLMIDSSHIIVSFDRALSEIFFASKSRTLIFDGKGFDGFDDNEKQAIERYGLSEGSMQIKDLFFARRQEQGGSDDRVKNDGSNRERSDNDPKLNEWMLSEGFELAIPIHLNTNLIGVVFLGKKVNLERYSGPEIEFLSRLCGKIAIPLHNAIEHTKAIDIEIKSKNDVKALLDQKTEFINRLSHDLRTPLTPLLSLLPILRSKTGDEHSAEMIDVCLRNSRYLNNLIQNTLELSRINAIDRLDLSGVGLKALLDETIKDSDGFASGADRIIVENMVPDSLIVKADRIKLRQVFENLITNARKYNQSAEKRIAISTREISLKGDEHYAVEISLKDNGIGIESKDLKNIFVEFYKVDSARHDHESTGLGLSIVKKLVELHKGTIKVESEGIGKGTTFTIVLPIEE